MAWTWLLKFLARITRLRPPCTSAAKKLICTWDSFNTDSQVHYIMKASMHWYENSSKGHTGICRSFFVITNEENASPQARREPPPQLLETETIPLFMTTGVNPDSSVTGKCINSVLVNRLCLGHVHDDRKRRSHKVVGGQLSFQVVGQPLVDLKNCCHERLTEGSGERRLLS